MSTELQGVAAPAYSQLLEDAARADEIYQSAQDVADAAFNRAVEKRQRAERFRQRHLTIAEAPPVKMEMDLA